MKIISGYFCLTALYASSLIISSKYLLLKTPISGSSLSNFLISLNNIYSFNNLKIFALNSSNEKGFIIKSSTPQDKKFENSILERYKYSKIIKSKIINILLSGTKVLI